MKKIFLLVLIFTSQVNYATTHKIGTKHTYKTPNALFLANVVKDGDTIEIEAGTYYGKDALAYWKKNNLLIRGINGRPHLNAKRKAIGGKGLWVITGNDITVENIEFSGTTVIDKNGCGIRFEGTNLTVRQCYFHDNDDGLLMGANEKSNILVEYCEFEHNGYSDGYSHNLYIGHVNKLIFQHNYTHHANIGHNLKSRAHENYILNNRIMDETAGNSSRLIDLPNGGLAIIVGNTIMQGKNAENPNLIGYGLEGLENKEPHDLFFMYNTLVNLKEETTSMINIKDGSGQSIISNNIFAGIGEISSSKTAKISHNYQDKNIDNLKFVDVKEFNYRLKPNSPAIEYQKRADEIKAMQLTPEELYNILYKKKEAKKNDFFKY